MSSPSNLPAAIGSRQTLRSLLSAGNVTTTLERVSTKWLKPDQITTQTEEAAE